MAYITEIMVIFSHVLFFQPKVLESLSIPPSPGESKIAKVMSQLLESGKDADMCFEIVSVRGMYNFNKLGSVLTQPGCTFVM